MPAKGNEGDAAPKAADRETADEAWAKVCMPAVVLDVIVYHSYLIGMPCESMVHDLTPCARTAAVQAPEGSFMSPALGGALVLTGMLLRTVLFSGDSSPF